MAGHSSASGWPASARAPRAESTSQSGCWRKTHGACADGARVAGRGSQDRVHNKEGADHPVAHISSADHGRSARALPLRYFQRTGHQHPPRRSGLRLDELAGRDVGRTYSLDRLLRSAAPVQLSRSRRWRHHIVVSRDLVRSSVVVGLMCPRLIASGSSPARCSAGDMAGADPGKGL